MEDIETDCELGDKKLSSYNAVEERIDSGLGSLVFESGLCNSKEVSEPIPKKTSDVSGQLAKELSNMTIASTDQDNYDSGLGEMEYLKDLNTSHIWESPTFSPQQVVDIFRGDEDGDNHLHLSIIHGLPQVTMQIIGLAPDLDWLNQTNSLLQTPLHIAVICRETSTVRRLICAGAALDVRDLHGNTPLHTACRLGYEDVVRMLITPVRYEETRQNKYSIPFQRFPQDLESKNYDGLTCLHLAAIEEHLHVMHILLSAGANINTAEGKSGRTVLHLAAEWGNMNLLKFVLSQKDVNINAKTYAGLTSIILALGRQHEEIVHVLAANGALCEELTFSDDSDIDASDEEMVDQRPSLRPFGALSQRVCNTTCG
ncbi:hypothetical protein Btru_014184 [Bulinus truncatus]|nr:hypothetical protein Btru_014184 [Bulinus truncatus]